MRTFTNFFLDISNLDALLPRNGRYLAIMESGEHIDLLPSEGETILAMLREVQEEGEKHREAAGNALDRILVSVKDAMNRTPFENGDSIFKE